MVWWGWYKVFEIGTVGRPEKRSEVLVARAAPKTQPKWIAISWTFPAKMPRGARKKFWSQSWRHEVQECCVQSWCLPCMHSTREEEKCNMKYSSLCKDIGHSIVYVPVFVLSVFVEGTRYIDMQNLRSGVLEIYVTGSDVLCPNALHLSTDWKCPLVAREEHPPPTSMGNHGGTLTSCSPYAHPGFAEICILHRTWSTVALGTYELAFLIKKKGRAFSAPPPPPPLPKILSLRGTL